ncbi:MAG: GspMb/PilO family protein [Planctomycetota bacterium]
MVICRKPLILGLDLLGGLLMALLATFAVFWIIMPLQHSLAALPTSREQLSDTHRQRTRLVARNQAAEEALRTRELWMREQATQPLANVGTFLELMTEQCQRSGVTLMQVQPLAVHHGEDYQSWDVQVRAQGTFPGFACLIHSIESSSPYVQVDNLLVNGPSSPAQNTCELAWTVRVNSITSWPTSGEAGP